MTEIIAKHDCDRCGHSPDWHSFKDNVPDVTSPDAVFSCNGPQFAGCDQGCPDFTGRPAVTIVEV